ncbi:MAG: DegQ family serine endoprotease [Deltaproteobacteria bacterium]|nr:MAG: DegQ family serine endoprotease [Deltaproteobacteria bacterium]
MFKKRFSLIAIFIALLTGLIIASNLDLTPGSCAHNDREEETGGAQLASGPIAFPKSFAQVAGTVKPAVVNIRTVHIQKVQSPYEFYFGDPFEMFDEFFGRPRKERRRPERKYYQRKYEGAGSGVVIDPEGYILTNYHVVSEAETIMVTVSGNGEKEYDGELIGKDDRTDLAVIKIKSKKKFPSAKLGNSDAIKVGEWVVAIGSPFGLEQTVTAGIISAKRQSLKIEGRIYEAMIQTDASINRGNSGGPLINMEGEVIGINTAIYAPTGVFAGVGFAIPINKAKEILGDLIEKGKVVRGWLGVIIQEITPELAESFGLKEREGALIGDVLKDTPAEEAGLKEGDIVIEFDGKQIKDYNDLPAIVTRTPVGKEVVVKVLRAGKQKRFRVKIRELKEEVRVSNQEEEEAEENLGMTVQELSPEIIRHYRLSDNSGVIITDIEPGSPADDAGFRPGDIIKEINRQKINDLSDYKKNISGIKKGQTVLFHIRRGNNTIYVALRAE